MVIGSIALMLIYAFLALLLYGKVISVIEFISLIIFITLILAAAVIDAKEQVIPNLIPLAMLIPAALRIVSGRITPVSAITGLLIAGGPLLIMALLKRGSIGGGDIKLACAAGLVLGFGGALFMLLAACFSLLCEFAVLKILGELRSREPVPFAPFIAIGAIWQIFSSFK